LTDVLIDGTLLACVIVRAASGYTEVAIGLALIGIAPGDVT
jgi:hypothetical protein